MISMVPPSLGPLHVCVELPGKEILVWYPNTLTVKEKKRVTYECESATAMPSTLSTSNAEKMPCV